MSEVSKACEGKKCLRLEGGFQCYLRIGSFLSIVTGFFWRTLKEITVFM